MPRRLDARRSVPGIIPVPFPPCLRGRNNFDHSSKSGELELITWEYTDPEYGYRMGWGNVLYEEAEYLKHKFEVTCGGDPARFFKEWPQGFRWTCCGLDGSTHFGCDHHGSGRKPCTCDFCRWVVEIQLVDRRVWG